MDNKIFDDKWNEHYQFLLNYIRSRWRISNEDSEDILMAVYIKAFRSSSKYVDINFQSWILQAVHWAVADFFKRRDPVCFAELTSGSDESDPNIEELIVDPRSDPATTVEYTEFRRQLMLALEELSVRERIVVIRILVDGETRQECAEQLDTTVGSVYVTLCRARVKLQCTLGEKWFPGNEGELL